jgi:hypothetical protein
MEGKFKFYPVGQGCFYAGSIKLKPDSHEFVFVYDCGSVSTLSYLLESIIDFKAEYKKIDLLMISHLDEDHFNGVIDLIKGIRVDTVILPYLPKIKRLALYSSYQGGDINYIQYLLNPVAFYANYDVKRILFINQGESDDGLVVGPPENIAPDGSIESQGELILKIPEQDDRTFADYDDIQFEKEGVKIEVKMLPFDANLILEKKVWEFQFYHWKGSGERNIEKFEEQVTHLIATNNIKDKKQLFEDKYRSKLQGLYRKYINRDLNYSSLCLYHGPLIKNFVWYFIKNGTLMYGCDCLLYFRGVAGTLLTGDQFIKSKKDFDNYCAFYGSKFDNTAVFQVPHHGSKSNWRLLPSALNYFPIYVLNYGNGRSLHPHPEVLKNILDNATDACIVCNTEFSEFEYTIHAP